MNKLIRTEYEVNVLSTDENLDDVTAWRAANPGVSGFGREITQEYTRLMALYFDTEENMILFKMKFSDRIVNDPRVYFVYSNSDDVTCTIMFDVTDPTGINKFMGTLNV
jgi:hypothetical protein